MESTWIFVLKKWSGPFNVLSNNHKTVSLCTANDIISILSTNPLLAGTNFQGWRQHGDMRIDDSITCI